MSLYLFLCRRIDHLSISVGVVRTACEIYNDASLTAYFPFNAIDTFNDYGINFFNGISYGTTTVSRGYSGQALNFSSNLSYFQAECFPSIETTDPPFTFSLWVNPATSVGVGSLIHVSSLQSGNGTYCYDLLGFTSLGELVAQWMPTATQVFSVKGPILPSNEWSHVVVVFEPKNGMRLYVNGLLSAVSSSVTAISTYPFTDPQFITLGNNGPFGPYVSLTCRNGTIPIASGAFVGTIDEFRIYNRDLTSQEICVLANL